ncbi:MAG: autotransporter outer membrane beta-barrel domain-containing protein [Holosporales bacterium]|jgi:hypothetical protein|nr:autotransporter outer membrane beta-barrel domain-containing protein [Holosporales bacterium]
MSRAITKTLLSVTCICALSVASASQQCSGVGLNVRGTLTALKGSKFKGNRPIKISSGGTIINHTRKFYVGKPLIIEKGGTLRNFGDVTIGFDGFIRGEGTIENAHKFQRDDPLTERANETVSLTEITPDETKVDEGVGFKFEEDTEYNYGFLTDHQLQDEAAYFDLVDAGVDAFHTPADAIIRTPGGGQLPGTSRQKQIAKRFIRSQEMVFVDEAMLPSTSGEETSAEEFFAYDADAYDVNNQQIFLDITGPTYIGASTYSEVGYVQQQDGVFVINGMECCLPPVNDRTVITQRRPGTPQIRERGDVLKFEPWDPGHRGIDRYYQPPESLQSSYWVKPEDRTPDGDQVAIYGGDNSWFNGVYNLHHGGVVIDNGGAMFGGVINLGEVGDEREVDVSDDGPVRVVHDTETLYQYLNSPDPHKRAAALAYARQTPPVELESQGGAKDEYNRPIVNMYGNATMYFNIPEDEDGNRIFSWYGDINGTPTDRIIFQDGEVYIKGDCSGFMGRVGICDGAKFVIRSSDDESSSRYTGTMFGGTCEIVDANGEANPNGVITIDSTSGLQPVTFTNGTVNVVASTDDVGADDVPRTDEITITGQTTVNMNYENVELHNTSVIGPEASLNLNTGARAVLENFTLDKGTLNITGDDLAEVEINGDVRMGSAITAWGNSVIDNIPVNVGGALGTGTWSLTDNVNLYFDFDPAKNEADHFTSAVGVTSGIDHTFVLSGVKLLSQPTQDRHTFTILDFSNAGADRYPEVVIDDNLVVVNNTATVTGTAVNTGAYTRVTGSDGAPGATLDNGQNYYFYGSNRAGLGNVMMVRGVLGYEYLEPVGLLASSLRGTTSVDLNSFDEYGYVTRNPSGKYAIWNKTHAARHTISTEAGGAKTTRYGTMLGYDAQATQLSGLNTKFIPTAYVAITRNNTNLNSYKSGVNEYTGGAKAAWFDSVQAIEAQVTYSYARFKTRNNPTLGLNATAHTISGVAKFGYNVTKIAGVTVRPELIAGYSWVHVSKAKSATDADIKLNNLSRISLIPGVIFIIYTDMLSVGASVRCVMQLGTKSKIVYGGETINDIDKIRKRSFEMALNVEKKVRNMKFGFRAAHSFGGIKGTKVTLSLGTNF